MRIPVTPLLSTKDGISNKNARLTNCLKEKRQTGEIAQIRPGLETAATSTGNGNGLVCFDGELVSVFGANLCSGTITTAGGVVATTVTADTTVNTAVAFGSGFLLCDVNSGDASPLSYTEDFVTFTELFSYDDYLAWGIPVVANGVAYIDAADFATDDPYIVTVNSSLATTQTPGRFYGYLWTGSLFIGAYTGAQSATSPDGFNWTPKAYGLTLGVQGFAYYNGLYVVVGFTGALETGYILTCTDDTEWVVRYTSAFIPRCVAAGPNGFVVGGNNGILHSADGITWGSLIPPPVDTAIMKAVYDPITELFVLGSDYYPYDSSTPLISSPDGVNWEVFGDEKDFVNILGFTGNGLIVHSLVCADYGCSSRTYPLEAFSVTPSTTEVVPLSPLGTDDNFDFAQSPL